MGCEGQKRQANQFSFKNIFIPKIKQRNVQQGIPSPTSGIPECLHRKYPPKGWIKPINTAVYKGNSPWNQHTYKDIFEVIISEKPYWLY
jgi:hypothetical protein